MIDYWFVSKDAEFWSDMSYVWLQQFVCGGISGDRIVSDKMYDISVCMCIMYTKRRRRSTKINAGIDRSPDHSDGRVDYKTSSAAVVM